MPATRKVHSFTLNKREDEMLYGRVGMDNPYMHYAWATLKELYDRTGWNLKTTPVAVIVDHGRIAATGIAGDGMHVIHSRCDRLGRKGAPYSECKYCGEEWHAEQLALRRLGLNARGMDMFLYGHWHLCLKCEELCRRAGVSRVFLLEGCEALFDHDHPGTVIGKPEQFA